MTLLAFAVSSFAADKYTDFTIITEDFKVCNSKPDILNVTQWNDINGRFYMGMVSLHIQEQINGNLVTIAQSRNHTTYSPDVVILTPNIDCTLESGHAYRLLIVYQSFIFYNGSVLASTTVYRYVNPVSA